MSALAGFDWEQIARWTALAIILVGLAQNALYLIQLLIAGRALSADPPVRRSAILWRRYADLAPPISLLSPAFNEEMTIVQSVRSLLSLQYPSYEVVVINDGSKDSTLQRLIDGFDLKPVSRAYDLAIDHEPIRGAYGSERIPRLVVVDF